MSGVIDPGANNVPRQLAAELIDYPTSAAEVSGEMSRLRELARRIRIHPRNAIRYATEWLRPSGNANAAIARWYFGYPDFLPIGDLLDALLLLEAIARGEIDHAETAAAQLEFFADVLEPKLMAWLRKLLETPEVKQAEDRAKMELFRVLANRELPKYATKAVLANPVAAMLRAGNAMEATDLNPGEILPHVVIRRQAEWSRQKNLLLLVVDDAAVEVVRCGGDPAPLFAISEIAGDGEATEFSKQWPAVAIVLRTAEAKRKAAAVVSQTDDEQRESAKADGQSGEPAGDTGESLPPCKVEDLPRSERLAYLAYQHAEEMKERTLTIHEAWEYLEANGVDDYKPPKQKTFERYITRARKKLGELKNSSRAGRAEGSRSIVRLSDV